METTFSFTSHSALTKCMFPNGHLINVSLQLFSCFQAGCSEHWTKPTSGTQDPSALNLLHSMSGNALEMPDDQNKRFPITQHELISKILAMGQALLHSKNSTYPIASPHCPASKQTHCLGGHMPMTGLEEHVSWAHSSHTFD